MHTCSRMNPPKMKVVIVSTNDGHVGDRSGGAMKKVVHQLRRIGEIEDPRAAGAEAIASQIDHFSRRARSWLVPTARSGA
jgi:hypothetical protein